MKKRDSFIKFPIVPKSNSTKPKKQLFKFLRNIKFPKIGIRLKKRANKELAVSSIKADVVKAGSRKANNKRFNNIKLPKLSGFKLTAMFSGLRGRIITLVIIITLLPLLGQTVINVITQSNSINDNLVKLNQAVNQSIVERLNAYINQKIATLELLPKMDVMSIENFEREKLMRKLSEKNYRDIMLVDLSGNIISSTDSVLRGQNVSQEEWYKKAAAGERFVSNAVREVKYKSPVITIAVPVLDQYFKTEAVAVAKLGMDDIQNLCKDSELGDGGIVYIVDNQGTIIAHPEYQEKVLNSYNAVENKITGAIEVAQGKSGTKSYLNDKNKMVVGTYNIIPATGWGLLTEIEEAKAMKPVKEAKSTGVIFAIVAFAIAVIGSLMLAWVITKPLVRMVRVVTEIKDGNFDKRLEITSKDEIGQLQNAFNLMTESLSQILKELDQAVCEISKTSKKLSSGAQITTSATEEISSIVEDVAEGAQTQMDTVKATVEVAKEISQNVVETAEKTQRVSNSAKDAAEVAKEGSRNINTINETIGLIKNNVVNSAELVDKLGKKSEEVTGIVKVIRDIAGKTNMLALNAAIEAARAGEAGRGFAVVANEIRNLADQTKDASRNIEGLLLEIQKETEHTVTAMNEGLIEVEKGTAVIGTTYSTFNKIIEDIHVVAEEIHHVTDSVLELKVESERISKAVEEVSDIAEATSLGTQSVLASTEEQSSAMQEINDSASQLNKMAVDLQQILQRFKI